MCWAGGRRTGAGSGPGCWRQTCTSPPLSFSWTGGTQSSCHLDRLCCQDQVVMLPGLARLPGLAVQARLYGLQIEELEEEGKKKLFTQMSLVQSATGNWDSLAQVIVQYQDNMLYLNLAAVLIAGRFATVNLPHL